MKLPSNVVRLTTVPYRTGSEDKLAVLLGGPCQQIRWVIDDQGPIP